MPSYVAFLRAINLGATRKFPKDAIRSAVASTGATDIDTYINTGNVRLTTRRRTPSTVGAALEAAFLDDRGFEVPSIVFRLEELATLARDVERLAPGDGARHYLTLLREDPSPDAVAEIESLGVAGESAQVRGRAVHVVIEDAYHSATLSNARIEKSLGTATTRDAKVIRAVAERWAGVDPTD